MLMRFAIAVIALMALTLGQPALAAEAPGPDAAHKAVAGTDAAKDGAHGRTHQVIEFDVATAVWVVIIFVVLLVVLYPTAWKSVLAGLQQRESRIRKDISDAETIRAKAEATLRQYDAKLASAANDVRDVLTKASADAERLAMQIRTRAQQETEEAKERATREIEAAKKQAITEIYEEAADLSTKIAEKILRRSLTAEDHRDLVRSSLEELKNVNRG